MLRIGGRLQNAELSLQFKHPVILPYRHWITELYIQKKHSDLGHMGSDVVFGALQQDVGLWPIAGVCTVRHDTRNCAGCRLRRQKRGKQLMAPLPASRLKPRTHVFAYAASDLACPFSVTVGRSSAKRWICLFVCMLTTAIRIEVSADLTTSNFINVFQRFLCFTGFRTKFLCTDGTNFVGATPINSRLNVVVRSPTPFGLGRNGCWPSRGPQLPRALPFIFSLCCPLNDRIRAAHSFFKIGRLSYFFFSLALLRLLILLLFLMRGNVHPNPGPIFPCSVCAENAT